jgi:hypothetical protein
MPAAQASSICETAAALVSGERAKQYGDALVCLQAIAELWNAIIVVKYRAMPLAPSLTALDVANMLEALKIARRYGGIHNLDNYVDGAGYAALAGEIAETMHKPIHKSTNGVTP